MSNGSSSSFCPDPLWDSSLTWRTSDPDLTECFRYTVLAAVPPAVLALHAPHYAADLRRRWQTRSLFADERAGGGALHWIRTILSLTVGISSFAKFLSDTAFGSDVFGSDLFRVAAVSITACATIIPAQLDRHFLRYLTLPIFLNLK